MSIPYNDNLGWDIYNSNSRNNIFEVKTTRSVDSSHIAKRAINEFLTQIFKESVVRLIQFIRDGARLVLKVPIRSVWTPIILSKNWGELERTKVNVKLTGYSLAQLVSVPVKSVVAVAALVGSVASENWANCLLNKSENWTSHLDGRASQLEALKEEGAKKAPTLKEYKEYKEWLYSIDPKLCR